MELQKDHTIRELGRTTLTLRPDLIFTPQKLGGESCYTIEDPVNSKFYRVGISEYTFISLLDGRTSIGDALALAARAYPSSAFTDQEAAAICKWLVETGLASTAESALPARLSHAADAADRARAWQRWNPAVIRLPLFRPDQFLARITPWLAWLYSWPAFLVWSVLVLAAAYQVNAQWAQFRACSEGLFAPHNRLWLALCWVVLKLLHESSHGIVCKKHGGDVREAGVMLILLAPIAYVDVTSSWRFRTRWQRIHTAVAGIYCELFVAALSALIWCHAPPGLLRLNCCNVVVMASFTTIIFNANPLMKYDGYYALSDLLEIPNLYASGQLYLQSLARRYLLGVHAAVPAEATWKRISIRVYGVLSLLWRVVFSVGIVLAAATYFHGAGIVVSCLAGAAWLGAPAIRFAHYLAVGTATEQPNRMRFAIVTGLAASSAAVLLTTVPWPGATQAPAVVEYAPLCIVRTASAGFVREIRVSPGQLVHEGEVLAVLENQVLAQEFADLVLAHQQSQIKLRSLEKKCQMAAYQAEAENLEALEKKHREKELQIDQLTLRAPVPGRIIGRNLSDQIGRYFKSGAEFASIGNEEHKEIRVSISQDDLDVFSGGIDGPVCVRLSGTSAFQSPLAKINPSACTDLPHPALGAPCCGPLLVRSKKPASDAAAQPGDAYELLEPRFLGIVSLSPETGRTLHAGTSGVVWLRSSHETIGRHLYDVASRWVRHRLRPRTD